MQQCLQTKAEEVNPTWHRDAVGGLWEEIGQLQFEYMVKQGLKPHHYLLDVGCGCLRGGVKFVGYLDDGHYFGIDKDAALLEAGRKELVLAGLGKKRVILKQMDDFSFQSLGQKFDYAIAQSVFTHLPINNILLCLINISEVLVMGGKFYATFFENPYGKLYTKPISHPKIDGPDTISYFDRDPFHYDFGTFKWLVEGTGLTVEYIGGWNHPRNQKMIVFTKVK